MSGLGQILAQIRKQKGMTLDAVGQLSGLSESAILRWESGDTMPRVDNLQRLLGAMGYKLQIVKKEGRK